MPKQVSKKIMQIIKIMFLLCVKTYKCNKHALGAFGPEADRVLAARFRTWPWWGVVLLTRVFAVVQRMLLQIRVPKMKISDAKMEPKRYRKFQKGTKMMPKWAKGLSKTQPWGTGAVKVRKSSQKGRAPWHEMGTIFDEHRQTITFRKTKNAYDKTWHAKGGGAQPKVVKK